MKSWNRFASRLNDFLRGIAIEYRELLRLKNIPANRAMLHSLAIRESSMEGWGWGDLRRILTQTIALKSRLSNGLSPNDDT